MLAGTDEIWILNSKKLFIEVDVRDGRKIPRKHIFLPLRFYVTIFIVAILIWRKFGTFPQLKYTSKIICNTFDKFGMICFDALGFLNLISRKKVVAAEKFTISHCEIESGDTMLKVIAHFSSWCHLRKKEAAAASEESASSVRRRTTSEKEHQKTRWT